MNQVWRVDDGFNFIEQEWEHPVCRIGITDSMGRDFSLCLDPNELLELRGILASVDGDFMLGRMSVHVSSGHIAFRQRGEVRARVSRATMVGILWADPTEDPKGKTALKRAGWTLKQVCKAYGLDLEELRRQLAAGALTPPYEAAVDCALRSHPEAPVAATPEPTPVEEPTAPPAMTAEAEPETPTATTAPAETPAMPAASSSYGLGLHTAGMSIKAFAESFGHSYYLARQVVKGGRRDEAVERDLQAVIALGGGHGS